MTSSLPRVASYSGKAYRSAMPPLSRISSIFSENPSNTLIRSVFCRTLCTAEETGAQKMDRIAEEILGLNQNEQKLYAALLRKKMGIQPWGSHSSDSSEKTEFGVKLVDFSLALKFDVMGKIKELTCLSVDEIEDLMEKTPAVVKKGLTREEAFKLMAKLTEAGATVVLA